MRGSPEERAAVRRSFKRMNLKEKAAYIATYYKLPLFTAFVVIAVAVTSVIHQITKKDVVLYAAEVNIVMGEDLTRTLTEDFLSDQGLDIKKNEVLVYQGLYIDEDPANENHQFAYASKLKILGAINARQMDIVFMNDNAYSQMSSSGLLLPMDTALQQDPELYEQLKPFLREETVIIEDNSIEYDLNEADTYEAVTEQQINAVDVSSLPVFRNAQMDGSLYIGVIANTTHIEEVRAWLAYLFSIK